MIAPETRRSVWERDGGLCGFCGLPVAYEDMEVDHRLPRCHGGTDEVDNLRPAHVRCNRVAGSRISGLMRKGTGRQGYVMITLRAPTALVAHLQQLAAEDRRSLNNYLEGVFEQIVSRHGDPGD